MLGHYLLILIRNLKRDVSTFSINLLGLSTGLTCALLIFLWVHDELAKNQFHEKRDRLYCVLEQQQYADKIITTTSTPGLLARTLKEEFPDVELAATTMWGNDHEVTVGDKNLSARGIPVGADYFKMFSYPLLQGDASTVLSDESSIVISDELAVRLFGNTIDVVGKQIILNHERAYQVSGVFSNVPASSFQFDFATSFEAVLKREAWLSDWGSNGPPTYVMLREGSDIEDVNKKIKDFIKSKKDDSHVTLELQKYSDRYLYDKWENGKLTGGRIEYVRLFSIVAIAILLIACINFMNLSTAQAMRRAKEIGVKKTVGAERNSLVVQFLTESIIVSLLAFVIALVVTWLFLPIFNSVTEKQITLRITDVTLLPILLCISLLTGLVAGSYPALFLSGFKPVDVLKGEQRVNGLDISIRKGLVIFQFAVAVILISSILVIHSQIQFVQNRSLGYDKENLVRIWVSGRSWQSIETLLAEFRKAGGVTGASSIGHTISGRNNNTWNVSWEGKRESARIIFESMWFNYETLDVLGFEIVEGRNFSREFGTDSSAILFNEAAIRVMSMQSPLGQSVTVNENRYQIIGVVKDFNFQSLHSKVEPAYMLLNPRNTWNVMVRLTPGNVTETLEQLKKIYHSVFPGFTFNYTFQDEAYARMYSAEQRVATLAGYFAVFAVIISCLGLYGLASHAAQQRLKEMGIRKALGLSSFGILFMLSRDFTRLVVWGVCIGLPVSYWWLNNWLQRFAFHIELSGWFFVAAAALSLLIAWLTVASKAWRAAQVNPVECIRLER